MRDDRTTAIHASAVAIGGRALVILGPSKSGKSSLALDLVTQPGAFAATVKLIGDDRIVLANEAGRIAVSPHPRIAGLIEKRGYGWFAMPYLAGVPVDGIISLGGETVETLRRASGMIALEEDISSVIIAPSMPFNLRSQAVREWYTATLAAHRTGKQGAAPLKSRKD